MSGGDSKTRAELVSVLGSLALQAASPVVLAEISRGNRILCQITSNPYGDASAIALDDAAFASGSLRMASCARPGKLFTASADLIVGEVGTLTAEASARIVDAVIAVLRAGRPA